MLLVQASSGLQSDNDFPPPPHTHTERETMRASRSPPLLQGYSPPLLQGCSCSLLREVLGPREARCGAARGWGVGAEFWASKRALEARPLGFWERALELSMGGADVPRYGSPGSTASTRGYCFEARFATNLERYFWRALILGPCGWPERVRV